MNNESSPAIPGYGPCAAKVQVVLARAAALSALEIIALAQTRRILVETDIWNAALDSLVELTSANDRGDCVLAARDEAARLTRLAARTAAQAPLFVRTRAVSHAPAFADATAAATKLVTMAAAVAVVADKLAPAVSDILTAPWRAVVEAAARGATVSS